MHCEFVMLIEKILATQIVAVRITKHKNHGVAVVTLWFIFYYFSNIVIFVLPSEWRKP